MDEAKALRLTPGCALKGNELFIERRRLGITVDQAAARLGITPDELLELELGAYACDWDEAMRLLRGGSP